MKISDCRLSCAGFAATNNSNGKAVEDGTSIQCFCEKTRKSLFFILPSFVHSWQLY